MSSTPESTTATLTGARRTSTAAASAAFISVAPQLKMASRVPESASVTVSSPTALRPPSGVAPLAWAAVAPLAWAAVAPLAVAGSVPWAGGWAPAGVGSWTRS